MATRLKTTALLMLLLISLVGCDSPKPVANSETKETKSTEPARLPDAAEPRDDSKNKSQPELAPEQKAEPAKEPSPKEDSAAMKDSTLDEIPETEEPELASTEPALPEKPTLPKMPVLDPKPFRVLAPTSQGPLLVDIDIRLDGESLATVFPNRINQILKDSDIDDSSDTTWDELLDYVASDADVFGQLSTNMGQRRNVINLQDRNRNKLADYDEVLRYLFRASGFSTPFRLQGTDYYRSRIGKSPLYIALDSNDDATIDAAEIESAEQSLLRFDNDGDQQLDIAEVIQSGNLGVANLARMNQNEDPAWNRRRMVRDGSVATDLTGYVDWTMASYMLTDLQSGRPFALTDNPIAGLDADEDEQISKSEARTIVDAKPDLILRADLSSKNTEDASLEVLWHHPQLQPLIVPSESKTQVSIGDRPLRLNITLADRRIGRNLLPPEAFAMLDANNDGGLDKDEIPDQFEDQYSFEELDADKDDKLTFAEIQNGLQPKAPIWNVQVRGRAAEFPDAVFAYLDQDNSLSLSTREIVSAKDRLTAIAKDGKLTAAAIPETFLIQLVRGDPSQRNQLFTLVSSPTKPPDAPRWATSMDVNGDGEIAWHEFIGSREQFKKLDKDSDGFIGFSEVK